MNIASKGEMQMRSRKMVMAKICVNGGTAVASGLKKIPKGVVGAVIEVTFGSDWDGLTKTAVFRGNVTRDVLDVGNIITIPAECVETAGHRLRVGFYGVADETLVIPTVWADLGTVQDAADPSGDTSTDPDLPVWAQLQRQINEIELIPGPPGDDYVLTDEDRQEIAELALPPETLQQIQKDIADLKYVPIDITQIAGGKTVEMGTVVNDVTVSWTLNKEPASQTLDGVDVDVSARSKAFTGLALTGNKTFNLSVTDERGAKDSASTAISFLNGVYYGVLESGAEADSAAILTLTRKLQGSKGITFTANAGATQKIVYAIPTRYGTPNFNVGGFDGGFAKVKTFDFTNASGYTESYDVWLSENVGLGSTTVKVS